MYKSRKKSVILCAVIFVILVIWMMLSVHCRAAETNNDEKLSQTAVQNESNDNRRLSVSVHLRIPSIMSIKTVSDEDLAMNLCRLWQAIPDGNLSM